MCLKVCSFVFLFIYCALHIMFHLLKDHLAKHHSHPQFCKLPAAMRALFLTGYPHSFRDLSAATQRIRAIDIDLERRRS